MTKQGEPGITVAYSTHMLLSCI